MLHVCVQAGHRLVEQQHLWLHGQHTGDADTFFLAKTQLVHRPVDMLGHADRRQGLLHKLPYLVQVQPQIERPKRHVLVHVRGKQLPVGVLEHQPNPLSHPLQALAPVVDRLPLEKHLADLRAQQRVQVLQQGGLARAVGAQNGVPGRSAQTQKTTLQASTPVGVNIPHLDQFQHGGHTDSLQASISKPTPAALPSAMWRPVWTNRGVKKRKLPSLHRASAAVCRPRARNAT